MICCSFEPNDFYHDGDDDDDDDSGGGDGDDEGVQQFPRYFVLCLRFATLRERSESKGAKDEF